MLTSAILSNDASSSAQLKAALEQTGMISSVRDWSLGKLPDSAEAIPDVVLLDISREPEPFFAQAARIRRLRPGIRMIVCSPTTQPSHQMLIEAMRCGVQDFIPKPADPQLLQETLLRISQENRPNESLTPDKLIVVMGAKGGVGATTVAVNLSVQFAQLPQKRAVLLDFARPLGLIPLQLNLTPQFTVRHAIENLDRLDSHFFSGLLTRHSSRLEVLAGSSHPEEWQQIPVTSLLRVINVSQNSFDFVVADLGSEYSSEWRSVLQMARMILLVAETNVPALWALERRLMALTGLGVDPERVRIIINRWRRGDEEALKAVERSTKRTIFACLPNDYRRVSEAITLGSPLQRNGNDGIANRFAELAAQIGGTRIEGGPRRSSLSNLFSKR
ncbi:MAG: hypothetical protein WA002_19765 [Candidatus Acidiferrales bacterium]